MGDPIPPTVHPSGEPVTFFGPGGARLAGMLALPDAPGAPGATLRVPAVLLCQGLSGIKELVLPAVAARLRAAGFAALAFDYRGYGQSEGEPGWILPDARVDDALHAFAYLATRPEVDPLRLGVYGLSLGGPVALCLAADETRARAVAAISGPGDGEEFLRALRTSSEWLAFKARIAADRTQRATTGHSTLVPLPEIIPLSPRFLAAYNALKAEEESSVSAKPAPDAAPARFWFASADAIMRFRPRSAIPRIAPRPVLLVAGEVDDAATIEQARALYAAAGPSAQLVVVPGRDHIDLDGGRGLEYQIGLAIAWFKQHLTADEG